LAVAFIGGGIGPVAILVQGQAWRWVWITVFVSAVLLPFTVLHVGRDEKCGPLCALLLLLGWTWPGIGGTACIALASVLWLSRARIGARAATWFRWAFAALAIAVGAWILIKCSAIVSAPTPPSWRAPLDLAQIRDMFALQIPAMLLGTLLWWGLRITRSTWMPMLFTAMLAAFTSLILPSAFKQPRTLSSSADIHEFADWANIIPPTSTVLVAPSRDAGAFVWFTLDRPNYLALDQSAGVVFSRATALEVRRRSEVLLPLMDPDWMILSHLRAEAADGGRRPTTTRRLTAETLIQVCADPELGFVISPEKTGFDPLPHAHAGALKDWNLYDCRKVRSALSAT
jgi:hypothetical protein